MSEIRLSIIIPFLNSHEIVRRQILNLQNIGVNDFKDVEILFMDDGSNPPLTAPDCKLERFSIIPTNETRPWTSSLARNLAAKLCNGEWCFMLDGDFILTRKAIEFARTFDGDRIGIRRELGVLDENGILTQDPEVLIAWGVPRSRIETKGPKIGPHPNHFIIKKEVFWALGGYDSKIILEREYPQGEDNHLKKKWCQARDAGKFKDGPVELRPLLYMFPNGQFCGDVDSNPFGFFHTLTRKTERNPWKGNRFE